MGKLRFVFALVFLVTFNAFAQQPPTQGAYFDPASINQIFKVTRFIGGVPVFSPSLLTDNGTQLLYNGQPVGGGGGGSATVAGAAPLFTCTGTNTITCSISSASAGAIYGNFTGSTAAPAFSTTPAFNGANITSLNFTQLGGAATIAQVPATLVQAVGTVSGNAMLKWVTSNTATNSSIVDNGTSIATTEPITAPSFTGSAAALTNVPVSQLTSSGLVSPITTGLLGEYHHQESSGATTGTDYSGNGNNGTYFGTPTLAGGTLGGMTSAGAGGMDFPATTAFNTALTYAFYSCLSAQNINSSTVFPLAIGGITVAGTPTNGSLKAFGLMTLAVNTAPLLSGALFGQYNYSPSTYTDSTSPTASQQGGDGCHLFTLVRDPSTDHLYIDGAEVSQYRVQAGSSTLVPVSGAMSVGMPHYATLPQVAYGFPYPIYYSAVFSGALNAGQVNALAGSVQTYEQLRGVTKPATTFADAGNQLLFIGDSITKGINGTPWVRSIVTTTPYIVITGTTGSGNNIATPSWKISDAIQECENRGYGSLNPNSATTAVIWLGTNSMALATGTGQISPATAYGELRRLVQCYKRKVPRVIITTMISRTGNGFGGATLDSLKNSINDLIRKDNAGADGTWDIASFAGFGADGAWNNPSAVCAGAALCFGSNPPTTNDGIHPSPAGETTVAALFSNYINALDSVKNGANPKLVTAATYAVLPDDIALNASPASNAQTFNLPSAAALVGTDRYISNVQTTGTNAVTIAAASGEFIDAASTLVCPNATVCHLRAVLGATKGLPNTADAISGAHWEQFGYIGGASAGTNATQLQGINIATTLPTATLNTLGWVSGTGWTPSALTTQTITAASTSSLGIMSPDGTTITCTGAGICSSTGGTAGLTSFNGRTTPAAVPTTGDYTVAMITGAAPLASPTFTGTTTASTLNATTYTKGGGSIKFINACTAAVAPTPVAGTNVYTCSVTGGATTSVCQAVPTNAAAQLLWGGTGGITAPLAGNIPTAVILSGSVVTITFRSTANVQAVAGGETFNVQCTI